MTPAASSSPLTVTKTTFAPSEVRLRTTLPAPRAWIGHDRPTARGSASQVIYEPRRRIQNDETSCRLPMHVTHGYPAGFDFRAQQVSQHDVQLLNPGGVVARYRDKNVRDRCQLTAGPAGESYRGEAGSPRLSYAFQYA